MDNRNYNNEFDDMFDFDDNGKIDMFEQYAELNFLSGGQMESEDAEVAYDYFMHSNKANISFILDFDDNDDETDDETDDVFEDDFNDSEDEYGDDDYDY